MPASGIRSLRWFAAIAVIAGCGGPVAKAKAVATVRTPAAGLLYHGVLPQGTTQPDSDVSPDNLDAYELAVGRKVAWVYFSTDWFRSRSFPAVTADWVRARGAVPFIRLMIRSQRQVLVTDPTFTLDRLLAGEFDKDLAAWADSARQFGSPLVVEYGTEVNGDWNPWSAPYNGGYVAGPEKFKRTYRHIVELMRQRGAANVVWALHYNGENFPGDEPLNVPASYYPGDDVVDWVGISVYGSETPLDHRCPSFRSLGDAMVPQLRAATRNKPLFIFEMGITDHNPGCPSGPWVQAALGDLLGGRWPEVRGFSWWNERWPHDVGEDTNMLVQDNPAVAAEFRAAFTGPLGRNVLDAPIVE